MKRQMSENNHEHFTMSIYLVAKIFASNFKTRPYCLGFFSSVPEVLSNSNDFGATEE